LYFLIISLIPARRIEPLGLSFLESGEVRATNVFACEERFVSFYKSMRTIGLERDFSTPILGVEYIDEA